MNTMLMIAAVLLALTVGLGVLVVFLGVVLMAVVLFLHHGSEEEVPAEAPPSRPAVQESAPPAVQESAPPAPAQSAAEAPSESSPRPGPRDEGTEVFANIDEFFNRLDSASEEDRTELLSKGERDRLYGFDVGTEEAQRVDFEIVGD